jgi:hypothetical protein
VSAARHFAVQFLHMSVARTSPYRAGDSRSGEVDVRATSQGPVTTVLVRRLSGSSHWSVLGTAGTDLVFSEPSAMAIVRSPLTVRGSSTAFEGVATIELRVDGRAAPIATVTVHGGSMGHVSPFRGVLRFDEPTVRGGALVIYTRSAKDGSVSVATAIRVRF